MSEVAIAEPPVQEIKPSPFEKFKATPEQRTEQNFHSFGKAQEIIRNQLLGTEENRVSPNDVANMDRDERLQLSRDIAEALSTHSNHSITEKVQRGVNEYVLAERRIEQAFDSEAFKAHSEDEVKKAFLDSVLTPDMDASEINIDEISVERMHGGIALRVSPEIFAKIMKPHVMEGKLDGQTDEQAFVDIAKLVHMTSGRLLDQSEIRTELLQQLGFDENTPIAIGFGDFVSHEEKEILETYIGKTIAEDPAIQRYRESYKGIPGSTEENIIIALHDLANRIDEQKRNITVGTLGITPEYAGSSPEAAISTKMVATIIHMSKELLGENPTEELRHQLMNEINGACIQPEELVKMWYRRLHPDEAMPDVQAIVLDSPDLVAEDFQETPGAIITFGREGRSIFDTLTLKPGDPITLPDGSIVEILPVQALQGGQAMVFEGKMTDIHKNVHNVVVKEAYFQSVTKQDINGNPLVSEGEREGRLDAIKSQTKAAQYFNELIKKHNISPNPSNNDIKNTLFDIKDLLKPLLTIEYHYSSTGELINQTSKIGVSDIWVEFANKLYDGTQKANIEYPISIDDIILKKNGLDVYTEDQRRELLQIIKDSLIDVGKQGEDPITVVGKQVKKLEEIEELRQGFEKGNKILSRINSPYIPKFYGIINGQEVNHTDSRYKALWTVEEKIAGGALSEYDADRKTLFPTLDSKLACMEQLLEAVKTLQHIPADANGPALDIVHSDLKPDNLLIETTVDPTNSNNVFKKLYVTDFNIAKIMQDTTHHNTGKGTAPYAPPEQAVSSRDARELSSDVYALGMIFYDIYTDGETLPIGGSPDKIPPELDELKKIIKQAIDTTPTKRYQDAQEMYDAFEKFYADYQLNKPFDANAPLGDRLKYLGNAESQLTTTGAIELNNFKTLPEFKKIYDILNTIEQDVLAGKKNSSEIDQIFSDLDNYTKISWKNAHFGEVFKFAVAEKMRNIVVYTAGEPRLWKEQRIDTIQAIMQDMNSLHPDSIGETEHFITMFHDIVVQNTDHAEDILEKLAKVTRSSETWTNTHFKDLPEDIVDTVRDILIARDVSAIPPTFELALEVVDALPKITADQDREKATLYFLENLQSLVTTPEVGEAMMVLLGDVAENTLFTNPLQNPYLQNLKSTKTVELVDYIAKIPGVDIDPEWIRTAILLSREKLTTADPGTQTKATALASTIITELSPKLSSTSELDTAISILDEISDPSKVTIATEPFNRVWAVLKMHPIIRGHYSEVSTKQLSTMLKITAAFNGGPNEQSTTAEVITLLKDVYTADRNNVTTVLNALHNTMSNGTVSNKDLFTPELAAITHETLNEVYKLPNNKKAIPAVLNTYKTIICNTESILPPGSTSDPLSDQTKNFISVLKDIRVANVMGGDELVALIEDISNKPPKNSYLQMTSPDLQLLTGLQAVIDASIDKGEVNTSWFNTELAMFEAAHTVPNTAEQERLADELLATVVKIPAKKSTESSNVQEILFDLVSNNWNSPGLKKLHDDPNTIAEKSLDILRSTINTDWDIRQLAVARNILGTYVLPPKDTTPATEFYTIMSDGVRNETNIGTKGQNAQDVMFIYESIFTNTWKNKNITDVPAIEQIRLLSEAVPAAINTAGSSADIERWNNTYITLVVDNFDKLTVPEKTEVANNLTNYIKDLSTRPQWDNVFLDMHDKLQSSNIQQLRQTISSVSNTDMYSKVQASVNANLQAGRDVPKSRISQLGASIAQVNTLPGQDLRQETNNTWRTLHDMMINPQGKEDAVANALTAMIQKNIPNPFLADQNGAMRMGLIMDATRAISNAVTSGEYNPQWVPTLTESFYTFMSNHATPPVHPNNRLQMAQVYLNTLSEIVRNHPAEKQAIRKAVEGFSAYCLPQLQLIDTGRTIRPQLRALTIACKS